MLKLFLLLPLLLTQLSLGKPKSSAIVDLAHVEIYFQRMPDEITTSAARVQVDSQISKSNKEKITALFKRIYTPENLMVSIREGYIRSLPSSQGVYRWFTSISGLKYSQARGNAVTRFSSTHTKENFISMASTLKISANRTNSIKTYTLNWQDHKTMGMIMELIDLAWLMASSKVTPNHPPLSLKAASDMVKGRRELYLPDAEKTAIAISTLSLTSFSESKIDELGTFPLTPSGIQHIEAFHRALENTLKNAAKTLQNQL